MPLTALFAKGKIRALTEYRSLVYYRGEVPTKEGQAATPNEGVTNEGVRSLI